MSVTETSEHVKGIAVEKNRPSDAYFQGGFTFIVPATERGSTEALSLNSVLGLWPKNVNLHEKNRNSKA